MKYTLNDLCNFEKGKTGIQKAIPGEYPLVVTGSERKSSNDYQFDCDAVCVPLVSSTGHGHKSINYIHYQSGKFALGTILVALIPKDKEILNAEYLREYLLAYKEEKIVSLMKGGANVTLPIKALMSLSVEVPSIKKQREIVDKVKKVRHLITQTNENYDHTQDKLAALKSSLISEAIRGKLVPQDPKDEPAEKLLERIKVEKERLVKEKRIRKEKLLTPTLGDEIPFGLPSGWIWCQLGDVSTISGGKRVPKGYQLHQSPTSHIYIRVTDMKSGTILDSNLRYIDDEVFEQIKNYTISKNDLYITIAGTIGEVGSVPEEFDGMNLTENAAKISPHLINKDFLQYLLSSPFCRKQFLQKTNQMAQPKLALVRIQSTLVPIPPLDEQTRIVEKIKKIMKICDMQEKNIIDAKDKLDQLNQTILREMFE